MAVMNIIVWIALNHLDSGFNAPRNTTIITPNINMVITAVIFPVIHTSPLCLSLRLLLLLFALKKIFNRYAEVVGKLFQAIHAWLRASCLPI